MKNGKKHRRPNSLRALQLMSNAQRRSKPVTMPKLKCLEDRAAAAPAAEAAVQK